MSLKTLFKTMIEKEASDLILRTNAYPRARIYGVVEKIGDERLTIKDMQAISSHLLGDEFRMKQFAKNLDVDFIYADPEIGRFRVNIFTQRGTPAVVARHVKPHVKSFEDLNLPVEVCKLFCEESKGLFLCCGPAGNGKSTTIASMIQYINKTIAKHIITVEDPIEFLFDDDQSIINQRELDIDVHSYPNALKHITQQSPDIIYIGNVRDVDTMRAAITATELGAFVMTTFHTVNAVQTLVRMINFFPPHLHDEVRMQISLILKGVIALRLLPLKDGSGRVPAFETMVVTPTIAKLIREGRIREIQNFIDQGDMFGMQSFRQSLIKLVNAGLVDQDIARGYADSKDEFDLAMKGIKNKFD